MHLPEMEERATEGQVMYLISRLEREGHYLTPRALARIHQLLTDCQPDLRAEGNQKELAQLIRERMQRDTHGEGR